MNVALIVTGDAEFGGLAAALEKAFPGHEFKCLPRKMNGFTSNELRHDSPLLCRTSRRGERVDTEIALLADTLITLADPGRYGLPADLVVLVEDLELANKHQPARIVQWVREAVSARIDVAFSSEARRQKARERVRERCSFHLLVPMLEAHFYPDPNAIVRAGALRPSKFDHRECDPEEFCVNDTDYLGAPRSPGKGSDDWRNRPFAERAIHPKAYLEYLCTPTVSTPEDATPRIASGDNDNKPILLKTRYDEEKAVDVLKNISWPLTIGREGASIYDRCSPIWPEP